MVMICLTLFYLKVFRGVNESWQSFITLRISNCHLLRVERTMFPGFFSGQSHVKYSTTSRQLHKNLLEPLNIDDIFCTH